MVRWCWKKLPVLGVLLIRIIVVINDITNQTINHFYVVSHNLESQNSGLVDIKNGLYMKELKGSYSHRY